LTLLSSYSTFKICFITVVQGFKSKSLPQLDNSNIIIKYLTIDLYVILRYKSIGSWA